MKAHSVPAVGWVAGPGHLGFRRAGGCLIGLHWSQVKRAGSIVVESLGFLWRGQAVFIVRAWALRTPEATSAPSSLASQGHSSSNSKLKVIAI